MSSLPNHPKPGLSSRSSRARLIGRAVLSVGIGIATFAAIAALGFSTSAAQGAAPPRAAGDHRAPRPTPGGALRVAVVLGRSGTDTADALVPYRVFGSSPAFAVYTVADTAAPAPFPGGLAAVPSYTFDQVAAGIAPAPDLVVVPAVSEPDGPAERGARGFVSGQYDAGAQILGICAGSRLLAASGILDGLRATSHWTRISALAASRPGVGWVRGERYVQDGRVTTTGGVTSSVWGSLKVMADLAGPAEATRVGNLINYPGWSLDGPTAMPAQAFGAGDLTVLGNTAFPWGRPDIDVQLEDGVDEIDAAALLEVYTYSQAATAVARSRSGTITTRHGLVLVTQHTGAPTAETLVARTLASHSGRTGFDAAFEQLSRTADQSVVRSVAKMLEYPLDRVALDAAPMHLQWRPGTLAAATLLLALVIGIAVFGVDRFIP